MERYISVLPEETPPAQTISDLDFEAIIAITHEDKQTIIDRTLDAWTEVPDYRRRLAAVMEGGPKQWDRLLHDDSAVVRMGLASKSTEQYQMALTSDPEPAVREKLAQYGTNQVRLKLLAAGEKDMSVAVSIVKNGSASVRKAAVRAFWDEPELLMKVVPYAVTSDMERLIEHPERKIRVETALHGTRAMCEKVLKEKDIGFDSLFLEDRLVKLDDIAEALGIPVYERELSSELQTDLSDTTQELTDLASDLEQFTI